MQKKNIFKALAFAMLMPAMLLTTACSSEDDVANTSNITNKGYALPVTVNATRGGDATRATFDGSKLNFSTGDKLFVEGKYATGSKSFAGALDYVSEGTFSGTIYAQDNTYSTYDALLMHASSVKATLLPNGYGSTGFISIDDNSTPVEYDDVISATPATAFVASGTAKATGVEQLSLEQASTYNNGFALTPQCAILNFTISGLEASEKTVTLNVVKGTDYTVTGSVTPTSGVATFAIGVPVGANIKDTENNLTVGSSKFTLPSSTTFAAGKIYNIARNVIPGALIGQFSVSANKKKVYFSKGNLRYASGTWSFFDHQYDYYQSYSADAWDKFGWSTSKTTYGMNISGDNSDYFGDFVDWGATMGSGWCTLSKEEWLYLFNQRSGSTVNGTENGRYAKAKVNNVGGVILFPDTYTHPDGVADPVGVNDAEYDTGLDYEDGNSYTVEDWTKMESAGCVFLPAAGYRAGTGVEYAGSDGDYWSSSPDYEDTDYAHDVWFDSDDWSFEGSDSRYFGHSVRLVRDVTEVTEVAGSYFTANSSGLKVAFSQGNLQATTTDGGTNWTWAFAEHQWDYVGNANPSITGNGTVSANGTVEFFCWSTASTYYGIHNSKGGDTYSGVFQDWGTLSISNGGGYTWRTLTNDEWKHIFNDRTSGATVNVTTNARWTHATINTDGTAVNGIILFPDGCKINSSSATWGTINDNDNSDWGTKCTTAQWTHLEELGCVFLPAAGTRGGANADANSIGEQGVYWSATPSPTSGTHAYLVEFFSKSLNPTLDYWRNHGRSVRLVREVEVP